MLVGFIALLMLLRYLSVMLVLSDNDSKTRKKKGAIMKKTSTTRIIISASLETVRAMGVGGIVGQLST